MNSLKLIVVIIPMLFFSQQKKTFDSLKLKNTKELYADDYGNIYLYKNKDFSFTKYDSLGNQQARMMLTFPYKIQSISNPLNIVMFSENAQEMKFVDQNLNEIQKIKFGTTFGFVKCVYAEDLQFAWFIDISNRTLVQYNFRNNTVVSSVPFNINFQSITDFLVYNNNVYILKENGLDVYNAQSTLLYSTNLDDVRKLKRINDDILILGNQSVKKINQNSVTTLFQNLDSKIVDKNSAGFLALIGDKLYLYKP